LHHTGTYAVKAVNVAGEVSASAALHVNGKKSRSAIQIADILSY
jgi:hypothetical protein